MKVEKERTGYHGNQSNVKKTRTFFQSQKTKKYEFRKKALLRLECAIKQHEEDMEHALYKDLGKSSFESIYGRDWHGKSELSYAKKHTKKNWMKTEQVKTPACPVSIPKL